MFFQTPCRKSRFWLIESVRIAKILSKIRKRRGGAMLPVQYRKRLNIGASPNWNVGKLELWNNEFEGILSI